MLRKSSFSPPGTAPACHVSPPSIVRTNVPPVPLAHTTFASMMLSPCKLAVVFECWAFHCPNVDVATKQISRRLAFTRASILGKARAAETQRPQDKPAKAGPAKAKPRLLLALPPHEPEC